MACDLFQRSFGLNFGIVSILVLNGDGIVNGISTNIQIDLPKCQNLFGKKAVKFIAGPSGI